MSRFTSRRPEKPERSKRGAYALYAQVATDLLHEVTSPLDRLPSD